MIELSKGKVNILIDGQFGSTGKGLFAEYVSNTCKNIGIAITNAGPNAGHTFLFKGTKKVAKQLPITGILNKDSIIYISQGAIIHLPTFFKELVLFDVASDRVFIHPQAAVIKDEDIVVEKDINSSFTGISSTQSGTGSALSRKIRREDGVASFYSELDMFIKPLNLELLLESGKTALIEVPQGLGLSLNSRFYPYCTSRDITIANSLNDCGIHPFYLGKVLACIRTFPIRVGNLPGSYSGDFYFDSRETTWEAIGVPREYTTNTKRIRRVATFSYEQYKDMLMKFRPDYVFLNFCNYLDQVSLDSLLSKLPEVTHLGFGDTTEHIRLRSDYNNNIF